MVGIKDWYKQAPKEPKHEQVEATGLKETEDASLEKAIRLPFNECNARQDSEQGAHLG